MIRGDGRDIKERPNEGERGGGREREREGGNERQAERERSREMNTCIVWKKVSEISGLAGGCRG